MKHSLSRRGVLSGLAACATGSLLAARRTRAAEPPHLDVKDPAATALGYVEDAGRVDVVKFPGFVKGSLCENCTQLEGKAGDAYRPCTLFPGKLVAVKGWCSGWAAEM